MVLRFESERVPIPLGKGSRAIPGEKPFGKKVNSAQVAIQGFKLQFRQGDNPIKLAEVGVGGARVAGNDVEFRVVCQYQDRTGNDEYSGHVDVLFIADVEA